MRAIDWVAGPRAGHIRLIDQTRLPGSLVELEIHTVDQLVDAIRRLAVRGAPALGVAGAMGVALAAGTLPEGAAEQAIAMLRSARPTAVNLASGVDRALAALRAGGPGDALAAALELRDDDIAACRSMARRGAELLGELCPTAPGSPSDDLQHRDVGRRGARHRPRGCRTTTSSRAGWNALWSCETRPLLQGARLTAWELDRMGARCDVLVDSAAATTLAGGGVDAVLVGADRIAANGDTANKIGTFALSLGAAHAGVPFLVVAPETTVDPDTPTGSHIPIEDRGAAEVCSFHGVSTTPDGTTAINPAFDVTPAELIAAIVTERRIVRPPEPPGTRALDEEEA